MEISNSYPVGFTLHVHFKDIAPGNFGITPLPAARHGYPRFGDAMRALLLMDQRLLLPHSAAQMGHTQFVDGAYVTDNNNHKLCAILRDGTPDKGALRLLLFQPKTQTEDWAGYSLDPLQVLNARYQYSFALANYAVPIGPIATDAFNNFASHHRQEQAALQLQELARYRLQYNLIGHLPSDDLSTDVKQPYIDQQYFPGLPPALQSLLSISTMGYGPMLRANHTGEAAASFPVISEITSNTVLVEIKERPSVDGNGQAVTERCLQSNWPLSSLEKMTRLPVKASDVRLMDDHTFVIGSYDNTGQFKVDPRFEELRRSYKPTSERAANFIDQPAILENLRNFTGTDLPDKEQVASSILTTVHYEHFADALLHLVDMDLFALDPQVARIHSRTQWIERSNISCAGMEQASLQYCPKGGLPKQATTPGVYLLLNGQARRALQDKFPRMGIQQTATLLAAETKRGLEFAPILKTLHYQLETYRYQRNFEQTMSASLPPLPKDHNFAFNLVSETIGVNQPAAPGQHLAPFIQTIGFDSFKEAFAVLANIPVPQFLAPHAAHPDQQYFKRVSIVPKGYDQPLLSRYQLSEKFVHPVPGNVYHVWHKAVWENFKNTFLEFMEYSANQKLQYFRFDDELRGGKYQLLPTPARRQLPDENARTRKYLR